MNRKERAKPFPGEMVRAILAGSKTQFREVIKPQPSEGWYPAHYGEIHDYNTADELDPGFIKGWGPCSDDGEEGYCSPYHVGQRLWVQETWQALQFLYDHESGMCDDYREVAPARVKEYQEQKKHRLVLSEEYGFAYRADDYWAELSSEDIDFSWRPSTQMPRWASRITLEVMDVRVEHEDSGKWVWVVEFKVVEDKE